MKVQDIVQTYILEKVALTQVLGKTAHWSESKYHRVQIMTRLTEIDKAILELAKLIPAK